MYDSESYQPLHRLGTSSKVSSFEIVQEDGYSVLCASTKEGAVHLYRDLTTTPTLFHSFRGLTELKQSGPTHLSWMPATSWLVIAGDTRVVRCWDLETERLAHQLHTCCASAVAGLTRYHHLVVLGCYDGSVRVLDTRVPPFQALVRVFKEHRGYVIQCDMQPDRPESLVSASPQEVKYWDLRATKSFRTSQVYTNASLSSLHIHPHAPLVVCGSAASQFKLFNASNGELIVHVTHYQGFLGQRLGKVVETPFHPYSSMFAVGCNNGVVSFYQSED
ncbi:hypothetical protein HMI56_001873 [Coelomomyces lativittatus]|nr:hypothetical protein HMI56_001873 [Coelomomyces lativittatus]